MKGSKFLSVMVAGLVAGLSLVFVVGCVGSVSVEDCSSGNPSLCASTTSSEKIDVENDPALFGFAPIYRNAYVLYLFWSSGRAANIPWPDTYWPFYRDSVNNRWQGENTLSPLEKYDLAFNNWQVPEGFIQLKPFSDCSTPFDREYYDNLGPAAKYGSTYSGNKAMRDQARSQEDIDQSCRTEADQCDTQDCSICRDQREFCYDEQYFEKTQDQCDKEYDACMQTPDWTFSTCQSLARQTCTSKIPGWTGLCHAWVPASILEQEPKGPVTYNNVTFEVSDMKALMMLMYGSGENKVIGMRCNNGDRLIERDENGRVENSDCRDINPASLHISLTNLIGRDRRAFAEDRIFDYQVWNQPILGYQILSQIAINGTQAAQLLDPDATDYRQWNPEAERFFLVETRVDWIIEASPTTVPLTDSIQPYTYNDTYRYILECDGWGRIIGGEWVGESRSKHPDFLWLPIRRGEPSNPYVSYENLRMIFNLSQQNGGH